MQFPSKTPAPPPLPELRRQYAAVFERADSNESNDSSNDGSSEDGSSDSSNSSNSSNNSNDSSNPYARVARDPFGDHPPEDGYSPRSSPTGGAWFLEGGVGEAARAAAMQQESKPGQFYNNPFNPPALRVTSDEESSVGSGSYDSFSESKADEESVDENAQFDEIDSLINDIKNTVGNVGGLENPCVSLQKQNEEFKTQLKDCRTTLKRCKEQLGRYQTKEPPGPAMPPPPPVRPPALRRRKAARRRSNCVGLKKAACKRVTFEDQVFFEDPAFGGKYDCQWRDRSRHQGAHCRLGKKSGIFG